MANESCALLDLRLDSDEMLAASNLLEDHHLDFQKIEGRKTDAGEWNISVVADGEYIGVSAYGPWGWSLLSVNDHIYVCEGGPWSDLVDDKKPGKIFKATVARIAELLSAPGWVFMTESLRDGLESHMGGQDANTYEERLSWLRGQDSDERLMPG